MKALDGRHKWEFKGRQGRYLVHTCRACGVTQMFETLIPDAFVDTLVHNLTKPNPYRELLMANHA